LWAEKNKFFATITSSFVKVPYCGGHYIKKFGLTSSRILTDIPRAPRVPHSGFCWNCGLNGTMFDYIKHWGNAGISLKSYQLLSQAYSQIYAQ